MPATILNKLPKKAKDVWNNTFEFAKDKFGEERAEKIAWVEVKQGLSDGRFDEPIIIKSEPIKFQSAELIARSEGDLGGKQYFLEGYLATDEINKDGMQLSPEFLSKLGEQIKGSKVNIKGDLDHINSLLDQGMKVDLNKVLTTEDLMIIKEAEVQGGKLWIKALLNKYVNNFDKVWYEIQQGFKDSFSIEFYTNPNQYEMKPNGDKLIKYVRGGNVHRFCLTGQPMMPGARVLKKYVE